MISVVGGFYIERCLHPHFSEKFGSGLRACHAIRNLDLNVELDFHTFVPSDEEFNLKVAGSTLNMVVNPYSSAQSIEFHYDHPLRPPVIIPRPDLIKQAGPICLDAKNVLYYGMLEGNAILHGDKVVYDPQSPVKPIAFNLTGSTAKELAVVVNHREASLVANATDEKSIVDFFFNIEKAAILVLKMGPKGAKVFLSDGSSEIIPVYKTNSVWPIGSGDVFASIFAYYWMEMNLTANEAAEKASFMTALYCNSKNFWFRTSAKQEFIQPLSISDYPKGKVYLAGPFFNFAQKWLINEAYLSLLGLGMQVFSPWHDVGEGTVDQGVAKADIDGLEECKIVFAVVDGLDSGTLFEIGYAIKKKIPVIVYVENETPESLTMLTGTFCIIEHDFTTALYKCLWKLAENE
ncbi:PfkB family carbohydrate kinase [Pedobacter nanyangensis]|uniref:PfkB family carbohydrate kinase n=1 Tax=Pedobacter nanyangensis TaxID=1562389 RepID=UPI000DE4AD0B|nr:PfkB family carbohydrate kinase [Pedobacter nanyangensis]